MIWINIKTTTLRESEYISASPTQQATWLKLLAYCSEHENGGVIDGAGGWNERAWLFGCGITLEEVRDQCGLWRFDGTGSLSVWNYPVEKELEVIAKREAGKRGGQAKAQNRSTACSSAKAQLVAKTDSACSSPPTEGVRSKRKEEGVKEEEISSSLSSSAAPIPENEGGRLFPIKPPPPKPKREPKPKLEGTADPRHHEITSGIGAAFFEVMEVPFIFSPRFAKDLAGFLKQYTDTAADFLAMYKQMLKAGRMPYSNATKKAADPCYLVRNWMACVVELENIAGQAYTQSKR